MTRSQTATRIACVLALAMLVMTTMAAPFPQARALSGVVEGTVTRSGSNEPLAKVRVGLSGGPLDLQAAEALLRVFAIQGVVVPTPAPGTSRESFLQTIAEAASARGISMVNPNVEGALLSFNATTESKLTAETDELGRFVIRGVPAGQYTVNARAPGFSGISSDGVTPVTVTVRVADGQTASTAFSMLSGGVISGRVWNAAGQPQFNIPVHALAVTYQGGFPELRQVVSKTTDDRGDFRLFWLPPGEYLIAAVAPSATLSTPTVTTASARGGAAGRPVQPTRTFYPGTLDVAQAQPVFVKGSSETAGVNVMMTVRAGVRISGVIRSVVPIPDPARGARATTAGTPTARGAAPVPTVSANLALTARSTATPDDAGPTTAGIVTLTESAGGFSGSFEIDGVLPGSYDLHAWTRESNPDGGAGLTFSRVAVDVADRDVTGLQIEIHPSVRVNGAVSIDGHAPNAVPVKISLQVEGSAIKRPVYQGIALRAVAADGATGQFFVPAITSGRFRVEVNKDLPAELYLADVMQGPNSVFDSGFDVGAAPPDPIHIVIKSGAGSVEGIIRNDAGKPASGAAVVLVPPDSRRANRALYRSATTDSTGRFSIRAVAPGDYKLFAWDNVPAGAYFSSRFLAMFEDRGRPVSVGQASVSTTEAIVITTEN